MEERKSAGTVERALRRAFIVASESKTILLG
jgi:hypothetical protein